MKRLLVLDPDRVNRRLATLLLGRRHTVLDEEDPGSALSIVANVRVDGVIVATPSPPEGGLRLIRDLRLASPIPRMVIVVVTANPLAFPERDCLDAGADGWLVRPHPPHQLVDLVEQLLSMVDSA